MRLILKRIQKYSIFLMVLFCLAFSKNLSAQGNNNLSYSLKIILDSTFNYEILDSITLSSDSFYEKFELYNEKSWSFDSVNKCHTFLWNDLIENEYTFKFQTKFTRAQNFKFNLFSDSTFILTNDLIKVDLIEKSNLLAEDTIEYLYLSKGCFYNYFQRSVLIKDNENNRYVLTSFSKVISNFEREAINERKFVSSKIINKLFQLQVKSYRLKPLKGNIVYSSTNVQCIYILVGNKLYGFNDWGFPEWNSYYYFQKKIIRYYSSL